MNPPPSEGKHGLTLRGSTFVRTESVSYSQDISVLESYKIDQMTPRQVGEMVEKALHEYWDFKAAQWRFRKPAPEELK